MKVIICNDYDDLSKKTAGFIADFINEKPDALFCPTAGDTPAGTYKNLVELSNQGKVDFDGIKFVGLDEWVGMNEKEKGGCKNFVYENLFKPLNINSSNIKFFDACSDNLDGECKKIDNYINENGLIDLMFLGLGMNGHVGLNEPGVDFDSYSHVIKLDPTTKKVCQKYFKEKINLEKGITLGIRHFMESKCVILIASGAKKAEIVKKVVEGNITNEVPASILQLHNNCYLFLDSEAASMLTR